VSDLSLYPGGDLVSKGLADLSDRRVTEEALLVLIAGPRLRDLGFAVTAPHGLEKPYEHRLYETIEQRNPAGAHADYNALIRRIVSFANAYGSSMKG
jgi:hypothetical protein